MSLPRWAASPAAKTSQAEKKFRQANYQDQRARSIAQDARSRKPLHPSSFESDLAASRSGAPSLQAGHENCY
jgi:hypothetical protein